MALDRDAFAILRLANPVRAEDVADMSTSAAWRQVEEVMLGAPAPGVERSAQRRPRKARRRRLAVVSIVALLTSAATVYRLSSRPTNPLNIGCYAAPHLTSRTEIVPDDGRPAVEICAQLWRAGAFGAQPVPKLVACVLPSGTVGVFPGEGGETCASLRLGVLRDTRPEGVSRDVGALRARLVDLFRAEECLDQPRANQLVTQELTARGLTDWMVTAVGAFTAERPCASIGVDVPDRTVLLVPVPRRP